MEDLGVLGGADTDLSLLQCEVGAWLPWAKVSLLKDALGADVPAPSGTVESVPSLTWGEGPAGSPHISITWGGPGTMITGLWLWLSPHP